MLNCLSIGYDARDVLLVGGGFPVDHASVLLIGDKRPRGRIAGHLPLGVDLDGATTSGDMSRGRNPHELLPAVLVRELAGDLVNV